MEVCEPVFGTDLLFSENVSIHVILFTTTVIYPQCPWTQIPCLHICVVCCAPVGCSPHPRHSHTTGHQTELAMVGSSMQPLRKGNRISNLLQTTTPHKIVRVPIFDMFLSKLMKKTAHYTRKMLQMVPTLICSHLQLPLINCKKPVIYCYI